MRTYRTRVPGHEPRFIDLFVATKACGYLIQFSRRQSTHLLLAIVAAVHVHSTRADDGQTLV